MALPQHEVTQPLNAGCPHEEIQAREAGREDVIVKDIGGDAFGVGIQGNGNFSFWVMIGFIVRYKKIGVPVRRFRNG